MEDPYHANFPCNFGDAPSCIYCECKILPSRGSELAECVLCERRRA